RESRQGGAAGPARPGDAPSEPAGAADHVPAFRRRATPGGSGQTARDLPDARFAAAAGRGRTPQERTARHDLTLLVQEVYANSSVRIQASLSFVTLAVTSVPSPSRRS